VDDSSELSTLLASLQEITARVSHMVEEHEDLDGVGQELVALERSLVGAVRRLERAARAARRSR
jgi:hypothetical protein